MTVSDADEKALDDFNAAIAKVVVNQVAQSSSPGPLRKARVNLVDWVAEG